jgi:cytochrome bd ubiquinol oxidase subunit I
MGRFAPEVGQQPWVVLGVMRSAEATTPFPTPRDVALTLVMFGAVYTLIFTTGVFCICHMLRRGPLLPSGEARNATS